MWTWEVITAYDVATAELAGMLPNAMPFSIIGSTEDAQICVDLRAVKGYEYLFGVLQILRVRTTTIPTNRVHLSAGGATRQPPVGYGR